MNSNRTHTARCGLMCPATRYTPRRKVASIIKILFLWCQQRLTLNAKLGTHYSQLTIDFSKISICLPFINSIIFFVHDNYTGCFSVASKNFNQTFVRFIFNIFSVHFNNSVSNPQSGAIRSSSTINPTDYLKKCQLSKNLKNLLYRLLSVLRRSV